MYYFQIIFNHYKCVDCGTDGDERLMPAFCHMEKVSAHNGKIDRKHLEGKGFCISLGRHPHITSPPGGW